MLRIRRICCNNERKKESDLKKLNPKLKAGIIRAVYYLLGNLLYACAVNMFLLENRIVGGGFAGLATVIHAVFPMDVGLIVFLMNIPFLIWAFFEKGWVYTAISAASSSVYSVILSATSFLPNLTNNLLLAAIFGGLFYAVGAVCMVKADANTGGTDLVARLLLTKFRDKSLGSMFIAVDGMTIVLSILVFKEFDLGFYGIISIYVCSVFTDKIITGFNYASICNVITNDDNAVEPISNAIMSRLGRGVTLQKAVGMYKHTDKSVLMVVVRPKEVYKLKDIVTEYDPNAFVVVAYANEVNGGGFQLEKGRYTTPFIPSH